MISRLKKYGYIRSLRFVRTVFIKRFYIRQFKESYSQYGEDLIIDKLLRHKISGFYVDVGAFSPHKLSNTKLFYLRGWSGINIDVNPITIKEFKKERPNDVNLNLGVSDKTGKMKFVLTEGMKSYVRADLQDGSSAKIEDSVNIEVDTLKNILDKYLPEGTMLDFISIDTEGNDINVLKGNDWSKYRPQVICVESFAENDPNCHQEQREFLKTVGYREVYNNGLNSFYLKKS